MVGEWKDGRLFWDLHTVDGQHGRNRTGRTAVADKIGHESKR